MTGYLIAFVFGIFIMGALFAQRERLGSGGFNAWLRGKKGVAVTALLGIVVVALILQSLVTVQVTVTFPPQWPGAPGLSSLICALQPPVNPASASQAANAVLMAPWVWQAGSV